MSFWELFLEADIVVQAVMVGLVLASIWTWAIIFEKLVSVRRANRGARSFEESFWSGGSLEELYDRIGDRPANPMQAVFVSAMREWRRSSHGGGLGNGSLRTESLRVSLQQRIERAMDISINREMAAMERQMVFLATVGSAAPFVGLFGTVWGIMNSFNAIAESGNTNLSVVAPGIAEALLATALGLVAAIPATIAYNKITTDLGGFGVRLESFMSEFTAIISRQLEGKSDGR
ncbi:MAG: protein TolQ [Alphaproteobacteria bacterium]